MNCPQPKKKLYSHNFSPYSINLKKKDEKSWKCTLLLNAKSLDNFYFNPYAIY